jgi:hypothetical protein
MEVRMKKLILLACVAGLAGCTANEGMEEAAAKDEATLAAQLRDYEQAGAPVSCVNMRDLRGNRSAGEGAIIFDGPGQRIWVNRPPAGCPDLSFGRALQTRTTSTQLCRGDIAHVFDPVSGISYGGCGLGDFTPYERRGG